MNRMEKPNKTYVSKPRKRLGIFCLIMDAVYVILGLSFYQYNNLPSLYQHILSYVWIALMAAALIAALIGIFASKEYELFRSCMFETVILAAQGVWLGASSSLMLVKNQQAPFPMYFLIGLFCLLAIGLFVQIDAIWFRSIMHFMMKGADNMVEIETQPQAKPASTPQATVHQGTVTLDTTHLKRSTMRRQTQAHPKIQVIDQNEARNAVKQAQAKARAKQVLAEDFEKRSRSTSRTAAQSAEKRAAQPRRSEKRTTA
jgi:branched-subunit amino acid transport protein